MAVDSTLELYTTLFGWLFYNSIWDVLSATGIVFLPFLGMLIDTVIRAYAAEESEDASNTTLRTMEVEIFIAFFVIIVAAVPAIPLNAVDLSFTPRSILGTSAQPVATVNNSRTTYGGGLSFASTPVSVDIPAFWMLVMGFSSGFNRAVMESVPPSRDFRRYADQLQDARINNPALRHEVNDFVRDCFIEARSKYLSERPSSVQIDALLSQHGAHDPDYIGSHVYREVPGYYDILRSDSIRRGFPWSTLRDVEWTIDNHPLYGKPFCTEWWASIEDKILQSLNEIDLLSAAIETQWNTVQRRDALIQVALLNSPPRWTTRGYDFAYGNLVDIDVDNYDFVESAQNVFQQGLAAYSLGTSALSFAAYLRTFLEGAPMMQALVLMGLYALLAFFVLMIRYKFSLLIIGALVIFTVKFWTVLWFFSYWVDQNLIQAFYPDPGNVTTLFSADLTLKRVILNFLTGSLYFFLPLLLSLYIGLAGIRTYQLDGLSKALTQGLRGRGIIPRLPRNNQSKSKTNFNASGKRN